MTDTHTSDTLDLGQVLKAYSEGRSIHKEVSEEHMHDVLERYIAALNKQDSAAILDLFAENIHFSDPVGGQPFVGKSHLGEFMGQMLAGCRNAKLASSIRTCTDGVAAVPFTLEFHLGDVETVIDIIDVMTFGPDGKVVSVEAHWGLDNVRMVRGDREQLVKAFLPPGKDLEEEAAFQTDMRKSMQTYIDGINKKDPAALLEMYHEDIVGVDPVGTSPFHGLEQISSFYDQGMADRVDLECSIRTSFGRTAAMAFTIVFPMNGRKVRIHTIDVMKFDKDGKIVDIKAIWGKKNVVF
jgi:steroid delta-isomerase